MNKRNFQKELDSLINDIERAGTRPKLLLHSCCAPCSSYCLIYLAKYFDIVDFYYNPNISPKEEHDKRSQELQRFISEISENNAGDADGMCCSADGEIAGLHKMNIKFIEGPYEPERFYEQSRGLENLPEGGERCFRCYRLRMEEAAKLAVELGCDYFTTTLSISPLKNAAKINEIGEELAEIYSVKHLPSDFKKKEGYKKSVELSAEHDLYRQNYCGCVYSKNERKSYENIT